MYLVKPHTVYQSLDKTAFFSNDKDIGFDVFKGMEYAFEQNMINWCKTNFANSDKLFIDIGAHVGTYSWSLAPLFKHTHSFEPDIETYNCLCGNSFLKGLSHKITTHLIGLSNENSVKKYIVRSKDGGGNGFSKTDTVIDTTIEERDLEVRTLDSYGFDNIGFIKIDVEGHEIDVFNGALKTIKQNDYPPILFESWQPGTHPNRSVEYEEKLRDNLFKRVEEIGYTVVPIKGNSEAYLAAKS